MDQLLTTDAAAHLLGVSTVTLRRSRTTGELFGKQAPPFLKLGRKSVRYRLQDIEDWLSKFDSYFNTAQSRLGGV